MILFSICVHDPLYWSMVYYFTIYTLYYVALEKTPSEIDLDNVSKRVGGDSSLLVHLGVPVNKIKPLSREYRNPVDACFFGLVYWRAGNIRNKALTWSVLLEALEEGAEERDYAEDLKRNIVDITNKAEQRQQSVEDDSPSKSVEGTQIMS